MAHQAIQSHSRAHYKDTQSFLCISLLFNSFGDVIWVCPWHCCLHVWWFSCCCLSSSSSSCLHLPPMSFTVLYTLFLPFPINPVQQPHLTWTTKWNTDHATVWYTMQYQEYNQTPPLQIKPDKLRAETFIKYIILVTLTITVLRQTRLPRPATYTGAGETPSAPCSISLLPEAVSALLFFLLPLPSPPSRCFTPCINIWNKLQEMRTICFLSTTRKQPDSVWWWMSGTGFVCLCEAHALVMLPGSGCGILTVLNPNCLKETIKKGIMLTGVGVKPSWKPGNRSGEDRSTEMSLNIQNRLCQKSREELQSSKKKRQSSTHRDESVPSVLVLSCSKQFMKSCSKHTWCEKQNTPMLISLSSHSDVTHFTGSFGTCTMTRDCSLYIADCKFWKGSGVRQMMLTMLYDTGWFLHSQGKINRRYSQDLLLDNAVGTTLGVFYFLPFEDLLQKVQRNVYAALTSERGRWWVFLS